MSTHLPPTPPLSIMGLIGGYLLPGGFIEDLTGRFSVLINGNLYLSMLEEKCDCYLHFLLGHLGTNTISAIGFKRLVLLVTEKERVVHLLGCSKPLRPKIFHF